MCFLFSYVVNLALKYMWGCLKILAHSWIIPFWDSRKHAQEFSRSAVEFYILVTNKLSECKLALILALRTKQMFDVYRGNCLSL